jgi:ribosome maturation factor RimP
MRTLFFYLIFGMDMTEDELFTDLEPLITSVGLVLVDCRMQMTKFGAAVQLVIYNSVGTGTDSCAKVHRMVAPRLEVLFDDREARLEVTSPGLERKFRTAREYRIFTGKHVWITGKDGREYHGRLIDSNDDSCVLDCTAGRVMLSFADIGRAKLEYSEEGGTLWA